MHWRKERWTECSNWQKLLCKYLWGRSERGTERVEKKIRKSPLKMSSSSERKKVLIRSLSASISLTRLLCLSIPPQLVTTHSKCFMKRNFLLLMHIYLMKIQTGATQMPCEESPGSFGSLLQNWNSLKQFIENESKSFSCRTMGKLYCWCHETC